MDINERQKWEGIAKSGMSSKELLDFNNLKSYEKEEYIEGYKLCVEEYNKVMNLQNSLNQNGQPQNNLNNGLKGWGNSQLNNNNSDNSNNGNNSTDVHSANLPDAKPNNSPKDALGAQQAAQQAQQSALQALKAAESAQQHANDLKDKADQTGNSADKQAADKAQEAANQSLLAANKAQQAADKAQQAADQAASAQQAGDSNGEQTSATEAGKQALLAANQAQKAANAEQLSQNQGLKQSQSLGQSLNQGQGLSDTQEDSRFGSEFDSGNYTNDDDLVEIELDGDGTFKFDGLDMSLDFNDPDYMKHLAELAGIELDSDDYENAVERGKELYNRIKGKLSLKKQNGRGSGNSLSDIVDTIDTLFAPKVDWRSALKKLFNTVGNLTTKEEARAPRRYGVHTENPLHKGRYQYPDIETHPVKSGIMQVFILCDNSGSMYFNTGNGNSVFDNIMTEIINLEKNAHIEHSAFTYFGAGVIHKEQVRTWDYKKSKHPALLIEMIKRKYNDNGGGTNVATAIASLLFLGKKMFNTSANPARRTALIVITDGADDYSQLKTILNAGQLAATVFLIINTNDNILEETKKKLIEQGIREKNCLLVNAAKEW